jgi:hypothetical protein
MMLDVVDAVIQPEVSNVTLIECGQMRSNLLAVQLPKKWQSLSIEAEMES